VADHCLLAADESFPIQARLTDGNAVNLGPLDFVQRVGRGNQHLLRRAAAIGAGVTEDPRLDHGDLEAGGAGRLSDAYPGVAST
jgi:hypothetical protein